MLCCVHQVTLSRNALEEIKKHYKPMGTSVFAHILFSYHVGTQLAYKSFTGRRGLKLIVGIMGWIVLYPQKDMLKP